MCHHLQILRKHTDAIARREFRQERGQDVHGGQVLSLVQTASGNSPGNMSAQPKILDDIERSNAAAHAKTIESKIQRWISSKKLQMPSETHVTIAGYRRATVECWYCSRPIALSSRTNKNQSWYWIVSNFTQHILDHNKSRPNVTIPTFFKTEPGLDDHVTEPETEPEADIKLTIESVDIQDDGNAYYEELHEEYLIEEYPELDPERNSSETALHKIEK